MDSLKRHTSGSIKISEDVIIKIAETAACEIEGTALKAQRPGSGGISALRKPIRVRIIGESAAIHLDIAVADGYNAVSVAESVQKSVKSAVQNMTGFTVTKVNVNVAGVSFTRAAE